MKRLRRIGLVCSSLLLVLATGLAIPGAASANRVDVRVDGYVFEPGSAVALEIVAADGAACFGDSLLIEQVELADEAGHLIAVVPYDSVAYADGWLGVVMLRSGDGSNLEPGVYELRVATSGGTFIAGLRVVSSIEFASLPRFVPGFPACNQALRLYRLFTEMDRGLRANLRLSDRMMVLLAGNPTTGYSWTNPLLYEYAPLRELQEMEYRADSTLLGAGGFFIYRYWAMDTGSQEFRYEYRRSWEKDVDPLQSVGFTVDVH